MPVVVEVGGVTQVITSATNAVRSYALEDGELLWTCSGLGANAIPAPLVFGDTVVVMTGYRDPNMMAIRLGGKGDLTGTEAVLWQNPKGCPYTAAPVLHDGRIYAAMDRGFLSCFDAATGEPAYREERLPRGTSLKASPVAAGEHLYVATESGEVHVVKLGPEFELVATNTLEDQFFVSSPVVVDGEMLLRSETHLFCIAQEEGE
jgi:outer membrane protein assembly factor BamB